MRASMSSASGCVNVSNVRTAGPPGFDEGAGDLERPSHGVVAEEHPQHGDVCGIEAVVSRGPLGVRRGEKRCPGRVGLRCGVAILRRSWNRVPRPPEVEVVLVVPAVDRRVRPAEVLQREEPRTVGGVEVGSCDELPGDFVPAQDGCALPPPGDVGLLVGPGRAGGSAEALDFVELSRPLRAVERRRWRRAELRGALDEERPHISHPWRRVEDRHAGAGEERLPVSGRRVRHPRRRPEPSVALSRVEHCPGGCVSHRDALLLERVIVDRIERGCVGGGERAQETRATGKWCPFRCRRDQL